MKPEYNRHHLIARSEGGTNDPNNIIRISKNTHDRIHLLFNTQTPIEQIATMLTVNKTVFTDDFLNKIVRLMQMEINNYYKRETYKGTLRREIESVLNLDSIL